ncbi:hypothetical protein EZV62_008206 [Acer yangbiense]|uniref:Uncharacterized protein n=1 Tax=Acer yangbiense TaxID=1000413 RepID=A0A5C7ICQ8_9ROSI|nr:hypothetical protein EZV62_008206 [Acer yangbiense]
MLMRVTSSSEGFKNSLRGYVDMLVKEFKQIGVKNCENILALPKRGSQGVKDGEDILAQPKEEPMELRIKIIQIGNIYGMRNYLDFPLTLTGACCLQQRFGGRCIVPWRFREDEEYEKVPVVSESELTQK